MRVWPGGVSPSTRNAIGLGALLASAVAVLLLVPDAPWRHVAEPSYQAMVAFFVTVAVVAWLQVRGWRGTAFERIWLAAFLAGMPLIYIASWALASEGRTRGWLIVEMIGLAVFATLAVLGVRRSPWFLAGGIVAHGLGWDLWHHGVGFTPDWYATGCLIADLGIGTYAATQAPAFHRGPDDALGFRGFRSPTRSTSPPRREG